MTTEEELAAARAQITDLEAELSNAYGEQLTAAQKRAIDAADELPGCAVTIAGLDETGLDELDIALGMVRRRAEEHGLLRHRPPHAVL